MQSVRLPRPGRCNKTRPLCRQALNGLGIGNDFYPAPALGQSFANLNSFPMKYSLLPAALLLTLASCASHESSAPVAAAMPPVAAATAFADSLAHLPNADRNDIRAARRYAQAVGEWYGSGLALDAKQQPVAQQVWGQYRAVLRTVFTSRELSYQHEVSTVDLDGYAPQAAQLAKGLLSLTQYKPLPTARQCQSDIQMVSAGYMNVQAASRRHLTYLQGLTAVASR
jgi:hypothetical protein